MNQAPVMTAPFFVAFCFLLGLVFGSFTNVVVYRLPRNRSVVRPGSRCPACDAPIRPRHNVPVLSWLWLRGRCANCRAAISVRYPAVELGVGLLFAGIAFVHGPAPTTLLWMALATALVAAALIDLEHGIIPDEISLGGLLVGLAVTPWARWLEGVPFAPALTESLAGALVGGGLLWIVGFTHARLAVALGRTFEHWPGPEEEVPRFGSLDYWTWFPGMGFGDVKLVAMIGAFVGAAAVIETVVAAALVGLVLGGAAGLWRGDWSAPFGFGPSIALGALLVLTSPVHVLPLGM